MSKEMTVGRINLGNTSGSAPTGIWPSQTAAPALFRLSLTLGAAENADAAIIARMTEYLVARGYNVTAPNEKWETKRELMQRLGLRNHDSLSRDIGLWLGRGLALPVRRSTKGKLLELCSNSDFDAFVIRNKKPIKDEREDDDVGGDYADRETDAERNI